MDIGAKRLHNAISHFGFLEDSSNHAAEKSHNLRKIRPWPPSSQSPPVSATASPSPPTAAKSRANRRPFAAIHGQVLRAPALCGGGKNAVFFDAPPGRKAR
jgi:hypothetical protein